MSKDNEETVYVLIHSPLVGASTWKLVAEQIRHRGFDVVVPVLIDEPASQRPFWRQHAESIGAALAHVAQDRSFTLVAHSGAGPLLPAIRQTLDHPIDAYVFVDAGIPRNGASRLDLMRSEDAGWAEAFYQRLLGGARFPTWSVDDLREIIPDEYLRKQVVAEIRPRALPFFTEPMPVFDAWPDAPCAYIHLSASYHTHVEQARQAGWWVRELKSNHFHMLVDAPAVTGMIVDAVRELKQREG